MPTHLLARLGTTAAAATSCLALAAAGPATAVAPAPPGAPDVAARAAANPLDAGPLGVYRGDADGIYPAYAKADGRKKRLLAKVALQPRVRWLGQWIPTKQVKGKVRSHIEGVQAGDRDVIVPMAVFRLWPRTEAAKHEPLRTKDRRAYRRWVDRAAAGIGSARVVMVLEPDLPVALTGWRPGVRLKLARYAARTFGALPRTTVYLDGSDSDWLTPERSAWMLRKAGIAHVRGFALGATHYAPLPDAIRYADQVADRLAAAGLPGKHAVIDTADNAHGFTWSQYWDAHPRGDFDNAETCRDRAERRCVTLGVPPTTDVDSSDTVDAYLWFGRPWLHRQASPFKMKRALQIARTTPY